MTLIAQKVKLKTIFKEHWDGFWKDYRAKFPKDMHKTIEEAVEKMMGCGDIANGYFHYKCVSCGHGDTKVGFSCKSRFCPRCGKTYTDEWVEKTAESVADVEHRHLVFTIPEEFRGLFYWNRKLLKQLADLVYCVVAGWPYVELDAVIRGKKVDTTLFQKTNNTLNVTTNTKRIL